MARMAGGWRKYPWQAAVHFWAVLVARLGTATPYILHHHPDACFIPTSILCMLSTQLSAVHGNALPSGLRHSRGMLDFILTSPVASVLHPDLW